MSDSFSFGFSDGFDTTPFFDDMEVICVHAEDRSMNAQAENRAMTVPAEYRGMAVLSEARAMTVGPRKRAC